MENKTKACEKCIFFDKNVFGVNGRCKRTHPLSYKENSDGDAMAVWPIVDALDWCGEFKGNVPTPDDVEVKIYECMNPDCTLSARSFDSSNCPCGSCRTLVAIAIWDAQFEKAMNDAKNASHKNAKERTKNKAIRIVERLGHKSTQEASILKKITQLLEKDL